MKILKKILVIILFMVLTCPIGYCEEGASHTESVFIAVTNPQYSQAGSGAEGAWNSITGSDPGYEITDTTLGSLGSDVVDNIIGQLDSMYGEGNYSIDMDALVQYAICGNNAEDVLLNVTVFDNESAGGGSTSSSYYSGDRYSYGAWRCTTYHNGTSHLTNLEKHLNIKLEPNRNNLEGKESLYMLGDEIRLTGNACNHIIMSYQYCAGETRTVTVYTDHVKITRDEDGNIIDREEWTTQRSYTESRGGCGSKRNVSYNNRTHLVSVKFDGFEATDNSGASVKGGTFNGGNGSTTDASTIKRPDLDSGVLKINKIENIYYDSTKGAFYGLITATCKCCRGSGCEQQFRLYFGDRGDEVTLVNLTIKVTPNTSGTAKVTGIMDSNNDGKIDTTERNGVTVSITNEKTLRVIAGNVYKIEAVDGSGHKYSYILTADGNIITRDNPYDYTMPPVSMKLIVHFTPIKAEGYTLYVTSNEGGRGWTDDRPSGTNYEEITTNLGNKEVVMQKISGVEAGTEFKLKYEAKEGYEFDRWEYRPFVNENLEEGTTKIIMPYSDLTATAIFKRKPVVVSDRGPIIKVTSNNEEWGVAYARLPDGREVSISEVVAGQEYTIVFYPKPGYYFTNWDYDSPLSPFKDADNGIIVMPNYDLEITAFFAPIPTQDEPARSGDVKFVAETLTPEDGIIPGTVPEDLVNIAAGAEVTFGVTANSGYEFSHWYFTDIYGNIITPDSEYTDFGSGKFIMPDYDIIAHAVFKKIETANLEVRIEGEGIVNADGSDIVSGTIITVTIGDYVELIATPSEGNKFLYWTDENGNILSYDEHIFYKVDGDKVIIAWFAKKNAYTLYITSMEGGNAFTKGNENHPEDSIIVTTDALGKKVYEIRDVLEGERFKIYYSSDVGYSFSKWEYKPYIIAESDARAKNYGQIEILMPASDLTVTAVFKNDEIVEEPEIRVTSNNAKWGTAWTVINGKETKMDKTYKAVIGEKYTVYYKANPGYYFVNWNYSTTKSPFVSENQIKMPNKDLEVMAFFSPIPEPPTKPVNPDLPTPPEEEKHSVDFRAEPPEGGSIPEDLIGDKEISAGSKVTIGVTPNAGWEFDYWYFTNSDGQQIEVEVHFDPDGSGYFIMPDEDVIAIAVFKKAGRYTLYITYTAGGRAWTIDGNTETVRIDEAIAEEIYELHYELQPGYEFEGWEFRWDKYGTSEGIKADIYQHENKALMPYSDMTVTAKFKKIDNSGPYKLRVISNNYLWGNAWIEIDGITYCWKDVVDGVTNQNAGTGEGIKLEAGKDYTIYYKAEEGFIYTNTLPATWFDWIKCDIGDYNGVLVMNIPSSELTSDVEIVVYFKPGDGRNKYDLTVSTDPVGAGVVSGAESGLKENEKFTVKVKKVNSGYKFKYWYYEVGTRKVIVSTNKTYTGRMPANDLELIAYFTRSNVSEGEGETEEPDDNIYYIRVEIEGLGSVTDTNGNVINIKEMKDGESITLIANPSSGYVFAGWMIDGRIVSTSKTETFTIDGESITVTACFVKKVSSLADGFKIISVRDLRWKDYFVNGSSLTGNVFTIPATDTTMLQPVNNYPDVLKMGYAVEFELTTSQIKPDKAVLVIEPTIINNKTGEEVPWNKVEDELSGGYINSDFKKIVIYGNGDSNKYTKMYQTSVKTDSSYKNNGISINKMTWNWLYYLPGDVFFPGYDKNYDITIRFNIELHETADGRTYNSSTLKEKLVLFEQTYSDTSWNGDVYKYSMGQSLLDDIYDNAQN